MQAHWMTNLNPTSPHFGAKKTWADIERSTHNLQELEAAKKLIDGFYQNPIYEQVKALSDKQPRTHKINTPERVAFRKKLADELYGKGAEKKERRIDIVTGLPASGKTTTITKPLAKHHGAIDIDVDMVRERLPEYSVDLKGTGIKLPEENGIGASACHMESNQIKDQMLERALANGDNIILSFMGRYLDKLKVFMKDLREKHGYKVYYHYVHTPLLTSIKRADDRFKTQGRFMPPRDILKYGYEPTQSYESLRATGIKEGVIDGYALYNNDVPEGTPVEIIEDTTG